MKVSIRTAYRIVKKTEDPESDPIFIPQYQDEETGEQWHNFRVPLKGRSGGHNTVYFYTLSKAMDYLSNQQSLEDTVVLQTPKKPNYEEETKRQYSYRTSRYVDKTPKSIHITPDMVTA
jgi:hypothetical protein